MILHGHAADRRDEVAPALTTSILRTALLLRLAVRLNRSRDPDRSCAASRGRLTDELELAIGDKWLRDHA